MKSLGTRIALILAALLFAVMLVAGVWIERKLSRAIVDEEAEQARLHAQTLLASLQVLMLNGQGTLAREWLDSMHGSAGIVDIEVLRRDGSEAFTDTQTVSKVNEFIEAPIFRREPSPPHHAPYPKDDSFAQALEGKLAIDLRLPEQITVLQPIHADTACLACHGYDANPMRGVLKLTLSRQDTLQRIKTMQVNLWAVAVVLVAVVAVAIWLALRFNVLGPINTLRDAIVRVGRGERDVQLPLKWRDELGEVVSVFNQMQGQLAATETRIRAVADNVFDAIITANEDGIIESVNPAVEKIFGYTPGELIGRNVSVLMPEPHRRQHDDYIATYRRTSVGRIMGTRVELQALRKDGTLFPADLALSQMQLLGKRHFIAIIRDITERKQQTAALEHQALHDALTELPNRTLLSDRIRQSILLARRDHQSFALIVMDLDRFKDINDTLGHKYGDLVLQQVARRMREVLRESDTIARLGGDEFAVLLPKTELDQASSIAAKLLPEIESPMLIEGQVLHVGASIGITLFPQHGEDEITLMQRADVAMYVAKRNHVGYTVYDPAKDQHSLRNLALLGELRGAIDRDQLEMHFQPKVSLISGRVCGVEALVRWRHPQHGVMAPDDFVPLAEQTGLIGPLTFWVLQSCAGFCQQLHAAAEDEPLDMAVNLSVRNLHHPRFSQRVAQIVEKSCGDSSRLRLEITETAIMADPPRALEVLGELSAMGIHLSIDDFGMGYSSLAHLKQMPVDELKIDKSFVIGMATDENDAVIVRSIIDLAHNIGLKVVAEGVEDQKTYDMLLLLGCDVVQGYHVCAPLPMPDLLEWLRTSPWGWRKD